MMGKMISAIREGDYSDRKDGWDTLTGKIIEACFYVHNKLGPVFIERIYTNALKIALQELKLQFIPEKEFIVSYDEKPIGKFRADFLIENKVIVELKAVEGKMPKIFESIRYEGGIARQFWQQKLRREKTNDLENDYGVECPIAVIY
jgi:GxxExxY protein